MVPSVLPSINNDSLPVISPLMNRPLLTVAWSVGAETARPAFSKAGAAGVGRGGSGLTEGVTDPDWVGFHIALKVFNSFPVLLSLGC
jgi:hypothetical protein